MRSSLKIPRGSFTALSAVIGFVVIGGAAVADDQPAAGNGNDVPAVIAAEAPAAAALEVKAPFATATLVSDDALGAESGKAQLQLDKLTINDQDLNGILQGNVATGTTNGDNTISGDAFSNSAGFVTAIQNTGNNVLIQDATIINISMAP
jgi:hypothetical protein